MARMLISQTFRLTAATDSARLRKVNSFLQDVSAMTRAATIAPPDAVVPDDDAQQSRVDDVYHEILARIVRGVLPGGSELKSTQLAQALGVSRTPVVQALSRLIADGIVTQKMNMRAVVRPGITTSVSDHFFQSCSGSPWR